MNYTKEIGSGRGEIDRVSTEEVAGVQATPGAGTDAVGRLTTHSSPNVGLFDEVSTSPRRPAESDADQLRFYLGRGRSRATKQSILARSCGWFTPQGAPDTRRVQKACEALRAEGSIVASSCSAPYGSYIAVTSDEIGAYKAQLFARVRAIVSTARQIDKAWESELADSLFHPCRNCGMTIGRDLNYCDQGCRNAWHSRARVAGYASMGTA